jgi:hypothetical protein
MSTEPRVARCACGQLSASCDGDPSRVVVCHCTECQRRTGSVFGVGAYYSLDRVQVSGAATLFRRSSDSGRYLNLNFCPSCGTTLYWELEAYPDMLGVAAGAFADPALPAPVRVVWTQHRYNWVGLPEGVEHFAQGSAAPKK